MDWEEQALRREIEELRERLATSPPDMESDVRLQTEIAVLEGKLEALRKKDDPQR